MKFDNICMGCMNELYGEKQCPSCGYHVDSPQISPFLPLRTLIGEKYIIGKVISSNSEGVTYMAYDVDRRSAVVLREFLPEDLVIRNSGEKLVEISERHTDLYYNLLNKFLGLWRNLASIRGFSALIPVIDIVEENNTAYAVTEYIESLSLRDFLLRSKTGYLNWEKAKQLFMPVISLLSNLHKIGIIHYGISPDTLLIGRDGKLRLSGFSISELRFERHHFKLNCLTDILQLNSTDTHLKVVSGQMFILSAQLCTGHWWAVYHRMQFPVQQMISF